MRKPPDSQGRLEHVQRHLMCFTLVNHEEQDGHSRDDGATIGYRLRKSRRNQAA